jgi:hypothetical protein
MSGGTRTGTQDIAVDFQPSYISARNLYNTTFDNSYYDVDGNATRKFANQTARQISTEANNFLVDSSQNTTVNKLLTANSQIVTATGTPTIASGACGTGTNGAVVAGSTDQSGQITIGASATTTCTLSWSTTLASAPKACVFFPANAAAAATGTTVARVGAPSTTQVVLTGSALASANYSYFCM